MYLYVRGTVSDHVFVCIRGIKGVIKRRKSKKDSKYNDQKKRLTENNDLHNSTKKTKN
jgi:hypothetical protein